MSNAPIGVFDSGLGGLSVWSELRRGLPGESLYYFGDGKNCPYGPKSEQEVRGYVLTAVEMLAEKGIKMLVVACNAATATSIDTLRDKYDFPIVGMEPAVKPAALGTKTGIIGILATEATFKGRLYRETSRKYADEVEIVERVGDGFVELVEQGMEDTPRAVEVVRRSLEPLLEKGADKIVLGCTHYPFLRKAMTEVIGGRDVEIIDPAPAILGRVRQLLEEYGLSASPDNIPVYGLFSAAGEDYQERIRAKVGLGGK